MCETCKHVQEFSLVETFKTFVRDGVEVRISEVDPRSGKYQRIVINAPVNQVAMTVTSGDQISQTFFFTGISIDIRRSEDCMGIS